MSREKLLLVIKALPCPATFISIIQYYHQPLLNLKAFRQTIPDRKWHIAFKYVHAYVYFLHVYSTYFYHIKPFTLKVLDPKDLNKC